MATNNGPVMQGIKNSWSLIAFARMKGKMQVGEFVNGDNGETFKSCVFTDPSNPDNTTNKCFVAFSSKLGVLTPQQIVAQKDELQVVELESGHYSLCKQGDNSWESVDLGI